MKTLKAQKTALTKEIKAQKEYLQELKSCMESQGERHFFNFEGRKCERYMYLGEFFFLSNVKAEEIILARLEKERAELDKIKECSNEVFTAVHEINSGNVEKKYISLKFKEDEDEDGFYNYLEGNKKTEIELGEAMAEVEVEDIKTDGGDCLESFSVTVIQFYDQEGNEYELNEAERRLLESKLEDVIEVEII